MLDFDSYMRMLEDFEKDQAMMESVHGKDMMRGGGKMKANMETFPDGTQRMTITEGAK